MATQTPLAGQQPAGDNEPGVTVETVGEAAPAQVVPQPQGQQPEELAGDSGTPGEQPPAGGDAPGGQPDAAAVDAAAQKKEKSDVQKRIDTLTRRRYELEGRNEELEIELARMKRRMAALEGGGEPAEKPAAAPAVDPAKPIRDNFTTYEDWVEAVSLYNAKKAVREEKEEFYRQQQATQQTTIVENWNKSLETAREKHEDFDAVVGTDLKIPQVAFNAIVASPVGTDIAYFLGTHPDIAASLSRMDPVSCVMTIGEIAAQFKAAAAASAPAPAPAAQPAGAPGASQPKGQPARPAAVQRPKPITSAASPPVEPVGSRSARSTKNPDEMSYQEFKKWREEGNGK